MVNKAGLRVEFFKADADGREGQTFLGFDTYTSLEATTNKLISFSPEFPLAPGDKIVATATDNEGNTSEFSASLQLPNSPPAIVNNGGGQTAALSVLENLTFISDVDAVDPDAGGALTYSISGGADAVKFTIISTTGVLSFVGVRNFENPTDVGGNNVYDVVVQVSDGKLTDTQTIAVTVTNVNEPPTITSNGGGSTFGLSIAENTLAVTDVNASDPDTGTVFSFSVNGDDAAAFAIDPFTGVLAFLNAPDYENPSDMDRNNVYEVVVRVSDGVFFDIQALTVTVRNVDDAPPDTSRGLMHHWTFDETSGDTAVDVVRGGDAELVNWGVDEPKWTMGTIGGALSFGTADNAVITPELGTNTQFAIAFWVNVAGRRGSNPRIVGAQDGGDLWAWINLEEDRSVSVLSDNQYTITPEPTQYGVWEHFAINYDAILHAATIFRNGVQVATGYFGGPANVQQWVFGHNVDLANHNDSLFGALDDLRVYDRLLSPIEVQQLESMGGPPPLSQGLIHHWTFNETNGNIARDTVGGNDGELQPALFTINLQSDKSHRVIPVV